MDRAPWQVELALSGIHDDPIQIDAEDPNANPCAQFLENARLTAAIGDKAVARLADETGGIEARSAAASKAADWWEVVPDASTVLAKSALCAPYLNFLQNMMKAKNKSAMECLADYKEEFAGRAKPDVLHELERCARALDQQAT